MQSGRGATFLARYLALVVIGAALVLSWSIVDRGGSPGTSLEGVSAEALAGFGMKLLPLEPGQQTTVSRGAAEAVVAEHFPDVAVSEAILVHLGTPHGGVGAAVWAIKLDHRYKDYHSHRVPASALAWVVAFVDANTGDFLHANAHGDPVGLKAALEAGEILPVGVGAGQ